MLNSVVLMVLIASTVAVSPPGPSCRLRMPQPQPQPISYRPPYSPTYYPSTGGMWVCYTSYGYGGSVPYPYSSGSGYWPYGSAVAAPVSAPAPAASVMPYPVAPPVVAARAPAPAPYPYYGAPAQARPAALPYPFPATVRRARKTRSAAIDEVQQQSLASVNKSIPRTESLPSFTDSSQADHPLSTYAEALLQAEQPLPSSPAREQPLLSSITSPNTAAGKLAVSVVFNSNSFMHNFFTHQLYPAVQALGLHLTLDLLPRPDGGCQPGSSKCLGSSFMVCAAEVLPIPTAQLAFSACFMKGTLGLQDQSYGAVMNTAKMCMGPFSVLNWMQMAGCVSSGRGEQLSDAATKRLNLLVPGQINAPIVAFNQEVVIADVRALNLFPALLCRQLTHVPEASTFCPYIPLY